MRAGGRVGAGFPVPDMANRTNGSAPYYSYEYYLDYLDLLPVDEKKLKANKHSIVIAFWVSLAAFVVLLFLILLLMSWSGPPHGRNSPQPRHPCRWSHSLPLPSCLRPAHQDRVKEPGGRAGAKHRLPCDGPPALPPTAATAHPELVRGGPCSIS